MFLVSLETYFVLCLSTITDISNRVILLPRRKEQKWWLFL